MKIVAYQKKQLFIKECAISGFVLIRNVVQKRSFRAKTARNCCAQENLLLRGTVELEPLEFLHCILNGTQKPQMKINSLRYKKIHI